MAWYVVHVNPEPWAVGPLDLGRRNGKVYATMGQNQQLAAYQEAVREEIKSQNPKMLEPDPGGIGLRFFFWRNRAEYTTPNQRQHRKHEADLTNLVKATEDALQGILFENDRDTRHIEAYLVEQGPEVEGKILIFVGYADVNLSIDELVPENIWDKLHTPVEVRDDNSWPPQR